MSDADRRNLMSLAFEPCGDGYAYYRNRWARGVPVSAAEREAFISGGVVDAMRMSASWSRRIAVAPRRHPSFWFLLDAMPLSFGLGCFVLAAGIAPWAAVARPWLLPLCFGSVARSSQSSGSEYW
jgi:hypothetical protein